MWILIFIILGSFIKFINLVGLILFFNNIITLDSISTFDCYVFMPTHTFICQKTTPNLAPSLSHLLDFFAFQ